MFSLSIYNNTEAVLIKLLKSLRIRVDKQNVIDNLHLNPDFPSMLALCETLDSLGVENHAYRLEFEQLLDLPCPFIVHTKFTDSTYWLVHSMTKDSAFVSTEIWKKNKIKNHFFSENFTGVVLIVPDQSKENFKRSSLVEDMLSQKSAFYGLFLIAIAAIIGPAHYFNNMPWQSIIYFSVKTLGLATTIILLIKSVDQNNPFVKKLCKAGSKVDCDAILSSEGATVFKGLTWSEVGYFYFAGTWLLLLCGSGSHEIWPFLAILNIISLPYTVYSLYYQAVVVKKYCLLCSTIQLLLWLEFMLLKVFIPFKFHWPSTVDYSILFISLLSPVVIWCLIRPVLYKLPQLQHADKQLKKFKYNHSFFEKLLHEQPNYTIPDKSFSIVLGNAEANNCIIMVSNPYCMPCATLHKELERLLAETKDTQVRIIFNVNDDADDYKLPISLHLMSLNELTDRSIISKALHEWFNLQTKDFERLRTKYPINISDSARLTIKKQSAWCKTANVRATPFLMLNGFTLPDFYEVSDLKSMIN